MELICVDEDGFRPVNNREARALIFTFGPKVGCFLINIIKIEYEPGLVQSGYSGIWVRVKNDGEIQLRSEYNSKNLAWLGTFIHGATHIWQRHTGLHREGEGGDYIYSKAQLSDLNLNRGEHATAVKHWFWVNYGGDSGLVDTNNQITTRFLWKTILPVFGRNPLTDRLLNSDLSALRGLFKFWNPVIEEIRDPKYVPALRSKSPNLP